MIDASRVLNRLSVTSQITAALSGTRTRSHGSAARIWGAVASRENTDASMQASMITAESLTRSNLR